MAARLAVILVIALAACGRSSEDASSGRPSSIVLVTLDTFRADRLARGVTPALDGLAARGLRFSQARSVAPLTLPAHTTIMTGLLPPAHGVRLNGVPLSDRVPTLARRLRDAGYQTRAAIGAFVLDRRFGLADGFQEYDDSIGRDPAATDVLQAERSAAEVVTAALAMLDRLPVDSPWFLWVHLYDAHAPYAPPPAALARAGGDAYNGEIASVDAELARLLAKIDIRRDADHTAIVIVGDHGESLGEHGEPSHGMLVFEAALRIPLIVCAPGVPAGTRGDSASLVDIAPTLLTVAGIGTAGLPGRNLLAAADDDAESYAESDYPTLASWSPVRALVRGRWKLVAANGHTLFDLTSDPTEGTDVSATHPSLARSMAARLTEIERAPSASGQRPAIPAEAAARLRSLGYLAPTAATDALTGGRVDPASVMADWSAFEGALDELDAGRPEQALPVLAHLEARHPDSPLFASTHARTLAAAGRTRDALGRFRSAVSRWPGNWELYHELAVLARDLDLRTEAMRAEEAALALDPDAPSALNGMGLLLADADRHEDASRSFERATHVDPTNAVYLTNLGNAYRAMGRLDDAAAVYRRALERVADHRDAANGLGVVLVQQNRPSEAIPFLERAAAGPEFIEAQLNLGIALQQAGQIDRAREQYRKVARAGATHARERDAARALLAQLGPS